MYKVIGIKYNNCGRPGAYPLASEEELNSFITNFVLHMLFQHVVSSWIIENNNHIKFEMNVEYTQCMYKFPWYNTTIFKKLNGQIS